MTTPKEKVLPRQSKTSESLSSRFVNNGLNLFLFLSCSSLVPLLFSLVHLLFISCSSLVHLLFISCSLPGHCLFFVCSSSVPLLFLYCSSTVPLLFLYCSSCLFFSLSGRSESPTSTQARCPLGVRCCTKNLPTRQEGDEEGNGAVNGHAMEQGNGNVGRTAGTHDEGEGHVH